MHIQYLYTFHVDIICFFLRDCIIIFHFVRCVYYAVKFCLYVMHMVRKRSLRRKRRTECRMCSRDSINNSLFILILFLYFVYLFTICLHSE